LIFHKLISFSCFGLHWVLAVKSHFRPFISLLSRLRRKSFRIFLLPTASRLESSPISCGKRLATGAVALQRNVVKKAYARAGVNVDLANKLKRRIQSLVKQTHGPQVLGKIGGFGGLFRANFSGMREPVLVASIDGVGTKLKIAFAMNKHDTVGADLVNHCVDDIAVLGARPLFFLDYIGCERLEPHVFEQLLRGLSRACQSASCALLGGETAQMPGIYRKGEYDLAGCIIGVVEREEIIDGQKLRPGDAILGLASNGLHTNGYSLAREILFGKMRLKVGSRLPGSSNTVGEELLRVHKNYQPLLAKIPSNIIKGLAHITGGGLIDNLPRILPPNCDAVIETKSWKVPRIFQILQQNGNIDLREMYQVFNMGIGMVAIVSESHVKRVTSLLRAKRIGRIERGNGKTRLVR
jgi:phosphoribosylformylglycinamidine cyclo-ligase